MFARVSTYRAADAEKLLQGFESVTARLEQRDGFSQTFLLVDRAGETSRDARSPLLRSRVCRGWPCQAVQRWLGHHSAAFTLDTYVHLLPDDLSEALDLDADVGAPAAPVSMSVVL